MYLIHNNFELLKQNILLANVVNRNTCLSLQQNVPLFECLGKYHK